MEKIWGNKLYYSTVTSMCVCVYVRRFLLNEKSHVFCVDIDLNFSSSADDARLTFELIWYHWKSADI